MQSCPFCGELIQPEAIKCRYCREFLNSEPITLQDSQPLSIFTNPTIPQPLSVENSPIANPVADFSKEAKDGSASIWLFAIFLFAKALLSPYINQDPNFFLTFIVYGIPGLILLIFALTFKANPKRAIYGTIIIGILETLDFAIGASIDISNSLTIAGAHNNIVATIASLIVFGTIRGRALTSLFKTASTMRGVKIVDTKLKTNTPMAFVKLLVIIIVIVLGTFVSNSFYYLSVPQKDSSAPTALYSPVPTSTSSAQLSSTNNSTDQSSQETSTNLKSVGEQLFKQQNQSQTSNGTNETQQASSSNPYISPEYQAPDSRSNTDQSFSSEQAMPQQPQTQNHFPNNPFLQALYPPGQAEKYFTLGNEYYRKQNYNKAIRMYTKAINIKPTDDTYYNRGVAYQQLGETQKAIADFKKILEVVNDSEAHARLKELGAE